MKLDLVTLPVSDVDRAKAFYVRAGFNADLDHLVNPELRFRAAHSARLGVLDRNR
jgi:catechol 2,3-dioxygenase-like lactoylglutathione lyase family enzyme